jgi:hypothetical protein
MAVFDAVMFLVIMLVASALIFAYTLQAFNVGEVVSNEADFRYSQEAFDAALEVTVREASYVDLAGNTVTKRDRSVEDLLLDELRLLDDGVPASNFAGSGRYQSALLQEVSAVVDTARYHFALFATYPGAGGTHSVVLSDAGITDPSGVPAVRFASQTTASMLSVGKAGDATFEFYLWRVR